MTRISRPHAMIFVIGLFAAAAACWALAHGVGVSRDSISYLHYAHVLLGRESAHTELGLQSFMAHYPPIYPAMLALPDLFRINIQHAAQGIDVVCFTFSTLLFAFIVWKYTQSNVRTVLAAALFMTQPAIASVHLWMASEPPFLLLILILFAMVARYVESHEKNRQKYLIIVGILVAAAALTRYIGLSVLPAACITVLLTQGRSRWRRDLCTLVGVAASPLVILAIVQKLMHGTVGHRKLNYHPLTSKQWMDLLNTFIDWIAAPEIFKVWWHWIIAAVVAGIVFLLIIFHRRRSTIMLIAGPIIVCYLAMLLTSVVLFDNATQLDDRLLAAVAVVLTLWLVVEFPEIRSFSGRLSRYAYAGLATAIVAVLIFNGAQRSYLTAHALRTVGLGFDSVVFKHSPLVRACRKIDPNAIIYSNYPEAILLHAGHNAIILPGHPKLQPGEIEPPSDDFSGVVQMLRHGGYVAYFKFRAGRNFAGVPMTQEEIRALMPFKSVRHTRDGVLLKAIVQ